MVKGQNQGDEEKLSLFRRHCDNEAVFIDAWCPGEDEYKIPEENLLLGEIKAAIFQVGCYIVRSALRVYTIHDSNWYLSELDKPAVREDVEMVRKDLAWGKGDEKGIGVKDSTFSVWRNNGIYAGYIPSWRDKLRITHEISARHNSTPDKSFTYICRATNDINGKWYEYIGDIYAVKEKDIVPDECASLLVYFVCIGDSHGGDTWYRFDPDGKITTFDSD